MRATGAEIIIRLLERQGVTTVAGIPGGANLPLYDALGDSTIRHILARHEQGAGFIAQGWGRVTGKAGVCFGTSGPGATNLVTAIADAKLDSVPLIAITGQVPTGMIGTDAFQEVDTFGMTLPITKHNYLVKDAAELLRILPQAFEIAESGRPGPVVIDVPKDVQKQEVEFAEWPEPARAAELESVPEAGLERLARMIEEAERPVLYVGGGIISSACCAELTRFARQLGIPVTSTLMGLGCFPPEDPLWLGMLGMHGARYTNLVLEEADLLLAFGVRFDDRATGKADAFCPRARVAHIDIDRAELGKNRKVELSLAGDAGDAIRRLLPRLAPQPRASWRERVARVKAEHPFVMPPEAEGSHPLNVIRNLGELLRPEDIVTTDVGQHQMWVAQAYPFRRPRRWLTSGGLGTMGFGLPAAIGASLAEPSARVVCVSGDGSLLMNIQELALLAELRVPVTVLVMNNGHLGLVRQQQELFYGSRYRASRFEATPDFAGIARAFGVDAVSLPPGTDPGEALRRALESGGPCLIDLPVREGENVFPMVPPGAANRDMIGGVARSEAAL